MKIKQSHIAVGVGDIRSGTDLARRLCLQVDFSLTTRLLAYLVKDAPHASVSLCCHGFALLILALGNSLGRIMSFSCGRNVYTLRGPSLLALCFSSQTRAFLLPFSCASHLLILYSQD